MPLIYVCKSWQNAHSMIRSLPPLATATATAMSDNPTCYLLLFFEPQNNMANILTQFIMTFTAKKYLSFSDAKIICSKYGWFLMSPPDFSVFFSNPISGTKIDLPDQAPATTMCFTSPLTFDTC